MILCENKNGNTESDFEENSTPEIPNKLPSE
jgi:hypothetical protein